MNRRLTLACALALVASGCNRRVFEEVKNACDRTIASDVDVPLEKAADILIVVDNSGSMQEEQDNLARNFFNDDGGCPLTDLANIPEEYKNPPHALYTAGGPLSQCGFIQLLAAFDNDFRVGVITTDVGLCDNRSAQLSQPFCTGSGAGRDECSGDDPANLWGYRPQRGCLQPDGPPGSGARKLISRADLTSPDANVSDIAGRFVETLRNIRTFGSGFERGLDAMKYFLDDGTDRGPGCDNDLDSFRRNDAQLVVMFLTDEEDCSHDGKDIPIGGGNDPNRDELDGEVCGNFSQFFSLNTAGCYEGVDDLPSVDGYVDALRSTSKDAKVAVIAGTVDGEASGCRVGGGGAPDGSCYESRGNSNSTANGAICSSSPSDPAIAAARQCNGASCAIPCCQADAGGRYIEFAKAFEGKALTDSICNASFRETMLDIAAFIAAVDVVELAEPPQSPDAVVVEIDRVETGDTISVAGLSGAEACATETGWYLEGEKRIVLCGDARPGPGDQVRVRARGQGGGSACE